MQKIPVLFKGTIYFKIRFNTAHGDSDLYWRVIVGDAEYLVRSLRCKAETYSESSFDSKANAVKYHIAGVCEEMIIDDALNATFK